MFFAWVTVGTVAVGVTLMNFSVEKESAGAWILVTGAITFLPFLFVFYGGRNFMAHRPFVTMTQHGATIPDSGLIRWGAILRIYVAGDRLQRNLYLELRDPLRTGKGADRLLLLHEGTELSRFRFVASDGEERTITGADLAPELQDLHRAYAAAGGLGAADATPPGAALPIPAQEEIVIPQALSDRWATGIMGALAVAGAVALTALLALSAKEDDFAVIEALLAMFVLAMAAIVFFRGGVSVGRKPLLVVNRDGLTHVKYGIIPWSEITSIQVDDFGSNDAPTRPVACAYLTQSYFRRRLKGRWFERFELALRNINWKFQLKPRLPLLWGANSFERKDYARNGLAMPPVTVEELARLIREFPREGSDKSSGA